MLRSQGDMRPPLSGAGSIWIQMIYTIMNGHRGGYELQASPLRLNPTTKMENGKDAQEEEGKEDANRNHVGP